jgi:hypothetical protein
VARAASHVERTAAAYPQGEGLPGERPVGPPPALPAQTGVYPKVFSGNLFGGFEDPFYLRGQEYLSGQMVSGTMMFGSRR